MFVYTLEKINNKYMNQSKVPLDKFLGFIVKNVFTNLTLKVSWPNTISKIIQVFVDSKKNLRRSISQIHHTSRFYVYKRQVQKIKIFPEEKPKRCRTDTIYINAFNTITITHSTLFVKVYGWSKCDAQTGTTTQNQVKNWHI